jgi:hypothetical protein
MTAQSQGSLQEGRLRRETEPPRPRSGISVWQVESRPKHRLRLLLEWVAAAPEVLLFDNESREGPRRRPSFGHVWPAAAAS